MEKSLNDFQARLRVLPTVSSAEVETDTPLRGLAAFDPGYRRRSTVAAASNSAKRKARRSSASASRPHWAMFQSSSTCAASQAFSADRRPRAKARATSAEPESVVAALRSGERGGHGREGRVPGVVAVKYSITA